MHKIINKKSIQKITAITVSSDLPSTNTPISSPIVASIILASVNISPRFVSFAMYLFPDTIAIIMAITIIVKNVFPI